MSAVEEYKAVRHDINHGGFPPFSGEQMSRIRDAADAGFAELEAKVVSLNVEVLRRIEDHGDQFRRAEQAEAALAEWQQMYREMSAATETLREKLRCMAPSDTEARCLSMVEEITELRHRLDDDCTDCATGVEKHRREQAEATIERLKTALRLAAGELSTYGNHTTQHPQDVYDELLASRPAPRKGASRDLRTETGTRPACQERSAVPGRDEAIRRPRTQTCPCLRLAGVPRLSRRPHGRVAGARPPSVGRVSRVPSRRLHPAGTRGRTEP